MNRMDLKTFKEYTDIYAADLSKWPVDLVHPALSFMQDDPEAKKYFDDLADIEDVMRHIPVSDINIDAVMARVMQSVECMAQGHDMNMDVPAQPMFNRIVGRATMLPWTGGMMAMAIVGFLIGAQPQMSANTVLDPVFYGVDQMMVDDIMLYEGGIF